MRRRLEQLGSLKLAVVLLVLLLVGLAAGTILESSRGAQAAGRLVYYAWWFLALEGLLAANVLASIATMYPYGRERIGYLLTHASLAVILAGALLSWFGKVEGQLQLWEGQAGSEIVNVDAEGQLLGRAVLPFSVKLERFRIEFYPGTRQPSNYRSEVEIQDSAPFQAAIWMNHELEHRGWRLYQSSYRIEGGRQATILSVSKDPGQNVVFFGYALLLAGLCTVLATRIGQARRLGLVPGSVALLAALALAAPLRAQGPDLEILRRLPVQHDGRVMPLDTVAREAVRKITGAASLQGQDPVESYLSWTFLPQEAFAAPMVEIGAPLAAAGGLPPGTGYASFEAVVNSPALVQLMQQAHEGEGRSRSGLQAEAEKLEGRLLALQAVLKRESLRVLPDPRDPAGTWTVPPVRGTAELAALAGGARQAGWPAAAAIEREIRYNRVRPTRVAWVVLLAALVLAVLGWRRESRLLDRLSFAGLLAGFAAMSWGLGTRWVLAGRIPAANMYESLLFLGWGVGLFAVVAFLAMRNRLVVLNACAMAALTMALTDLLPIDAFIHPVPPVLAGTPWLAIHVPIIMVSYSVLALGVVVAHMQIGTVIFVPRRAEAVQRMADLLYWYIQVGSILLIAGIITGSVWASQSWGRYWGWDPKEVWSLVAFLAYLAILHARWDGWIGAFGVAAISIVAFQTILMTYLGVNFVLASGLHSYGMGDSPVVAWMLAVAAAETAFLLWGWRAQRRLRPA